jgi:serine/threonine-protein kinase
MRLFDKPQPDRYVPPKNAPVPGLGGFAWDEDVATDKRRPADRARAEAEGDRYYQQRALAPARGKYLEAWRADPQPAVAMKLGQLAFEQGDLDEARGWWGRVKRDAPTSKFVSHIDQVLPR